MSRESSAKDWFNSAEKDRLAAKHLLASGDYEACAFHCQQAVEKLLKAIIVKHSGKRPPRLHDLQGLLAQIIGIEINEETKQAASKIDSYYFDNVTFGSPRRPRRGQCRRGRRLERQCDIVKLCWVALSA